MNDSVSGSVRATVTLHVPISTSDATRTERG